MFIKLCGKHAHASCANLLSKYDDTYNISRLGHHICIYASVWFSCSPHICESTSRTSVSFANGFYLHAEHYSTIKTRTQRRWATHAHMIDVCIYINKACVCVCVIEDIHSTHHNIPYSIYFMNWWQMYIFCRRGMQTYFWLYSYINTLKKYNKYKFAKYISHITIKTFV